MKHILAILMIVISFPVMAQNNHEFCSITAANAEFIMTARQAGVAANDLYDRYDSIKENFEEPETAMGLVQAIILDAYNESRFTSREYIERAITEFKSKAYIQCLEVRSD